MWDVWELALEQRTGDPGPNIPVLVCTASHSPGYWVTPDVGSQSWGMKRGKHSPLFSGQMAHVCSAVFCLILLSLLFTILISNSRSSVGQSAQMCFDVASRHC